jgi:tyrosyl-tRNA synthetase
MYPTVNALLEQAAEALFGGGGDLSSIPTSTISSELLGSKILDVLIAAGIIPSKSEGKRLIQQGGLYVNDEKICDMDVVVDVSYFKDGKMLVRKGKKTYNQIVIE